MLAWAKVRAGERPQPEECFPYLGVGGSLEGGEEMLRRLIGEEETDRDG